MDNIIINELASNIKFNNVNITDRFFGYYQNLIINLHELLIKVNGVNKWNGSIIKLY